jgi:uncharacterized membrane protein YeaQ/YmgE (transglycosylase-associated protein family)
MAGLAWVMMGIAIWHFAVFVPDRFWAGIVGAFLGSVVGAFVFGYVIHGFSVPGRDDTTLLTTLEAIPGTLIGLAVVWTIGVRKENAERGDAPRTDAFGRAT